jgi:hypothetical protein
MIVDMHDAVLALWGPAMWRFTKCLRFVSEVFLEGLSCSFLGMERERIEIE